MNLFRSKRLLKYWNIFNNFGTFHNISFLSYQMFWNLGHSLCSYIPLHILKKSWSWAGRGSFGYDTKPRK